VDEFLPLTKMSFSDVGRRNTALSSSTNGTSSAGYAGGGSGGVPSDNRMYAQLSDAIIQYQKNVGILQKLSGMPSSSQKPTQINAQLDVLNTLGGRIDQQLRAQEGRIQRMSRTEAARCRATHVKLTRDFRRVETTYQKMKLEIKQKKDLMNLQQRTAADIYEEQAASAGGQEQQMQQQTMTMEMMLQEDQLNEQLMREREAEIREINKGMHTVNEIYKDLAHIVQAQQDDVDKIEEMMEESNANAKSGLNHIEKAAQHQSQCIIS